MEVQDLNPNSFADLFPAPQGGQQSGQLKFSMEESLLGDLMKVDETDTQTADTQLDKGDPSKEIKDDINKDLQDVNVDLDITDKNPKKPEGGTDEIKVEELKGLSEYFHKSMKDGKLTAVNDVDEQGNKIAFVPKTAEDFDEVIKIHLDYNLQQAKDELDQQWYNSKSPAWKAISQYAEMVDDPTQLIPFLQGVKTIQSVDSIDENEIDGAEEIVRIRMEQRNDPEEVIKSQIDSLKSTGALVATAKSYKPIIIKQEKQILAQQIRQKELEDQALTQEFDDIRRKAYEEIEKPFFGKEPLKRDEKAAIFNLIAQPSEETQGFALYDEIDRLFAKRDFETLKQIALLVAKKESFYNYIGMDVANKTATKLQRKLQAASDGRSATGNDYDEEKIAVVNRNKSTGTVRFGR